MKRLIFAMLIVACLPGLVTATSLYLEFTEKSEQTLKQETRELSKGIRTTFAMGSMETAQQKIDAYDYISHFKKILLYGSKLATYADHEADLDFARDNELFKGLPEDEAADASEKQDFIDEKYRRMGKDVKNEIDTYRDLMMISLDACELLTGNDFTGFTETGLFKAKMDALFATRLYTDFAAKQDSLARTWPDLFDRIKKQLVLWEKAPAAPSDPLVDPGITRAIAGLAD